jgi:hypothetical protein
MNNDKCSSIGTWILFLGENAIGASISGSLSIAVLNSCSMRIEVRCVCHGFQVKDCQFFFSPDGIFFEVGSRERNKAYRISERKTVPLSITRSILVRSIDQSLASPVI